MKELTRRLVAVPKPEMRNHARNPRSGPRPLESNLCGTLVWVGYRRFAVALKVREFNDPAEKFRVQSLPMAIALGMRRGL